MKFAEILFPLTLLFGLGVAMYAEPGVVLLFCAVFLGTIFIVGGIVITVGEIFSGENT